MFPCRKIRRVKDKKGRREWAREVGVRWESWDVLASKKWMRLEDTGRVDDEGRAALKRVHLMEEFFENVHRQIKSMWLKESWQRRGAVMGRRVFSCSVSFFCGLALGLEGSAHGLAK